MSGGSVIRGLGGGSVFGLCGRWSGVVVGVMERMRCCRWPFCGVLGLVGGVFFAIGLFGVGLSPLWWDLVGVQWQGSVVSIGIGRPGVVAYASVG